jgi:hypothetical protein
MVAHHLLDCRHRYLRFVEIKHLVVKVKGTRVLEHALAFVLLDSRGIEVGYLFVSENIDLVQYLL